MFKIELEKKKTVAIILAAVIIVSILIMYFVYMPLFNKFRGLSQEIKKIENDIMFTDTHLSEQTQEKILDRLIRQDQIVMAIDEITKEGKSFDVNFISITPKEIEHIDNASYSRLPIELTVESKYKDFGLFLGALRQLEKSIITIKSFNIHRKEEILPLLRSTLVLEVYLKDG